MFKGLGTTETPENAVQKAIESGELRVEDDSDISGSSSGEVTLDDSVYDKLVYTLYPLFEKTYGYDKPDVSDEEGEIRKELMELRVQHSSGQLKETHKIREIRKSIAQLKTLSNEDKEEIKDD